MHLPPKPTRACISSVRPPSVVKFKSISGEFASMERRAAVSPLLHMSARTSSKAVRLSMLG